MLCCNSSLNVLQNSALTLKGRVLFSGRSVTEFYGRVMNSNWLPAKNISICLVETRLDGPPPKKKTYVTWCILSQVRMASLLIGQCCFINEWRPCYLKKLRCSRIWFPCWDVHVHQTLKKQTMKRKEWKCISQIKKNNILKSDLY